MGEVFKPHAATLEGCGVRMEKKEVDVRDLHGYCFDEARAACLSFENDQIET